MTFHSPRLVIVMGSVLLGGASHAAAFDPQHERPNAASHAAAFDSQHQPPNASEISAQTCKRAAPRTWQRDEEWVVPNTTPPCVLRVEKTEVALVPDGDTVTEIRPWVARDNAGRFYTYDRDNRIAVWSRTGALERTFGRRGQGPGELGSGLLSMVPAGGDLLYVLDNVGRWHLFRNNGDLVQTVQSSGARYHHHFTVLDDGRLLDASGRDNAESFFTIWSPLGDSTGQRPVVTQRIATTSASERQAPSGDRRRWVAYNSGDSFWAGPPSATGRGYQLEQWSTNGTRLKSIRRNVSWFPDGADRAKPGQDLLTTPLHRVNVWDLGDDLLLVVTEATNPGDWSHLRGRPGGIDVAMRDKRTSIYAEVIDIRSGQLLAQQGPLKPSEAALPIYVFGRSMIGYQYELTPEEDNSVRVLRLRLESK